MAPRFYLINGFPGTGKTYNAVLKYQEINALSPNNVLLTSNNLAPIQELSKRLGISKGIKLRTIYGFSTSACYHESFYSIEEMKKLNQKWQFKFWSDVAQKLGLNIRDLDVALGINDETNFDIDDFDTNSIAYYLIKSAYYINKFPDKFLDYAEKDEKLLKILEIFENAVENYELIHYIIPKVLAYRNNINIFRLFNKKDALDVDYLIVDEAQNLSYLDAQLILKSNLKLVYMYGDLFQSIYDFIGVDYKTILYLEKFVGFENIETLTKSKRLPNLIASKLTNYILRHPDKELLNIFKKYSSELSIKGEGKIGRIQIVDANITKLLLSFDNAIILTRRKRDIKLLKEFLGYNGIYANTYSLRNAELEKIATAIINNDRKALESLAQESRIASEIINEINRTRQFTLKEILQKEPKQYTLLELFKKVKRNISKGEELEKIINLRLSKINKNEIYITTIHKFQGKEAENVFVFYDISDSKFSYAKEYNVVFVALSRTKRNLFILNTQKINYFLRNLEGW